MAKQTSFTAALTKEQYEYWAKRSITDEQWENVAREIDGRLDNFYDNLLSELINDQAEGIGIFQ